MSLFRRISAPISVITAALIIGAVSCVPDTAVTPTSLEGTWKCAEKHSAHGNQAYSVNIQAETGSTSKIRIYNFLDCGTNLYVQASISQSTITIPSQKIYNHTIAGSGTVAAGSKSISLNYTDDLYGETPVPTVTASYTR